MSDERTVKERLAVIEKLLDNHLRHCEYWLKYYLPAIITGGFAVLAVFVDYALRHYR